MPQRYAPSSSSTMHFKCSWITKMLDLWGVGNEARLKGEEI